MTFKGLDNQTVELKITNYQFPDSNDREWDGNWLNIYINVISKIGNWQTIDPSLTTIEVQQLIDWFVELSLNKKPQWLDQEFTEPNLTFKLLNKIDSEQKLIRISFDLESRPQSAKDEIEYFVDFKADNNQLIQISNDLKNELSKYPERK
jgi:hypothetical protein